MKTKALLLLVAFTSCASNSWAAEPFKLFVTGGQDAGGSFKSEIEDAAGNLVATGTTDMASKTGFGLELRFEKPSGFFFSGLLEYNQLQAKDSSLVNKAITGSGMIGFQGTGKIRPWAGATLGLTTIVLDRTSATADGYTVAYKSGAFGASISPRVGIDWLVTNNLVIGAYGAYVISATEFNGTVTENATSASASFTELSVGKWFTAGLRLGFSFGNSDSPPELPRTASAPKKQPSVPSNTDREPASPDASSESAANSKERLKRLKALLDDGSITTKEYLERRKKILDEL